MSWLSRRRDTSMIMPAAWSDVRRRSQAQADFWNPTRRPAAATTNGSLRAARAAAPVSRSPPQPRRAAPARLRPIGQTIDALARVALLPADHRRLGHPDPLHDVLDRPATRSVPAAPPLLVPTEPEPRLEHLTVPGWHVHGDSQRHA